MDISPDLFIVFTADNSYHDCIAFKQPAKIKKITGGIRMDRIENVVTVVFDVESEAYQALSELKKDPITPTFTIYFRV